MLCGVPTCGVGQPDPPNSVPFPRAADARNRENDRPKGVGQSFHVSLYKVEPSVSVFARNLLSAYDRRAALRDEVEERGP
jgi:hypothetical protein